MIIVLWKDAKSPILILEAPGSYGSFRKFGVPYFGVLIIRSPIFGKSRILNPKPSLWYIGLRF